MLVTLVPSSSFDIEIIDVNCNFCLSVCEFCVMALHRVSEKSVKIVFVITLSNFHEI